MREMRGKRAAEPDLDEEKHRLQIQKLWKEKRKKRDEKKIMKRREHKWVRKARQRKLKKGSQGKPGR